MQNVRAWSALTLCLILSASAATAADISFKKHVLDNKFRAEGVAVGDFNRDGKADIAAGNVYYLAPDWKMHPMQSQGQQLEFDPKGYSNVFSCFAYDVNHDGWTDVVYVDIPGQDTFWYENPGKKGGDWPRHSVVKVTNGESPLWTDVDGDGTPDLVCGYNTDAKNVNGPERCVVLASPDKDPFAAWPIRQISEKGAHGSQRFAHGFGVGDINGDGRNDVIVTKGWWEGPEKDHEGLWKFHPANLGEDCAHMIVYDFDGDGDNDVVSSSAHKFGIWWHEQTPDGWKTHEIEKSFSQVHAVILVDVNGDGLKDFVCGKRWFAHGGHDPGSDMPAVLYWYELQRENGKPKFIRHDIDNDSGVGTQFETADVNGDGLVDVVVANKKGVFWFEQKR